MIRQILKKSLNFRYFSINTIRENHFEDINEADDKHNSNTQNNKVKKLCNKIVSNQTYTKYKPATMTPFAELDNSTTDSNSASITEFIDNLSLPLPVSFNLAAYVNHSESLQKLVQLGVDLSAIEKKPENAKYILKLDFEKDIKHYIQFLYGHGVDVDQLGKFITKNPLIFKENIKNLEVRINYFKSKRFSSDAISRIISSNPLVLSMDTKAVDSRLGSLQKQFFLSGNEIRNLITKSPKLITYNFSKFREKLFVMKEEMGFTGDEMKSILLRKPKIWTIGRKQLTERFNILHNVMGISHEHILEFPDALLTRALILNQRHQYLLHLNRAQYDPEKPMYVSLKDLATTSDTVFCEACAKTSVEKFNEYLRTL